MNHPMRPAVIPSADERSAEERRVDEGRAEEGGIPVTSASLALRRAFASHAVF
jgi:hypothetical protein